MNDEQAFAQVTALEERRRVATLGKDFDAVDALLGTTLHYVHGSGVDEDRAQYLQRLREGHYDYRDLTIERREVRRFGDVVLVNGDMRIHVVIAGHGEKHFVSRYLQAWALESGAWRMVSWQSTPLPQV